MPGASLTVVILTKDEGLNLPIGLATLADLGAEVVIVDSGSSDDTVRIADEGGCRIYHRPWTTYADQLNWALSVPPISTQWVMRLDADERLTSELVAELKARLPTLPEDVTGLLVKRQVWFWGRWIRHGGYYPTWLLRVWRNGVARCEDRWMDEHMVLAHGRTLRLEHDIIDENHKGLTFWTDKHNRYADREVKDLLAIAERSNGTGTERPADQAGRRRWVKETLYARAPLFWRAFAYWAYRYFLRLGFLDGRPGLVFHFLQAFWYRMLVDAKIHEKRRERDCDSQIRSSQ